jgi:hypothetical protein
MLSEKRNDKRLARLTDAEFRVWFNLLCYASEQVERGVIAEFDDEYDEVLDYEVAGGDHGLLMQTLQRLVILRIIDMDFDSNRIEFISFAEEQQIKPSDSPERIKERVTRYRSKETRYRSKETRYNSDVTPCNAFVTPPDKNREESEQNQIISEQKARGRFVPPEDQRMNGRVPSEAEVGVEADMIGRRDIAEPFRLHYEKNGWLLGNGNPMGNWRAALKDWANKNPPATVTPDGKPIPTAANIEADEKRKREKAEHGERILKEAQEYAAQLKAKGLAGTDRGADSKLS